MTESEVYLRDGKTNVLVKLNYPKEWFDRNIEKDGDVEIGAGLPPAFRAAQESECAIQILDTRIALGQFVELWRRNQGWNAEKLAEAANIDVEEVFEIERNPFCAPEPDAICKLAEIFGVPSKRMLELAGLQRSYSPHLREDAIRFAARSESVSALSEVERQAFEAFVTTLTSKTKT